MCPYHSKWAGGKLCATRPTSAYPSFFGRQQAVGWPWNRSVVKDGRRISTRCPKARNLSIWCMRLLCMAKWRAEE